MTTTPDIVERLRKNTDKYPGFQNLNTEAADEIERLRKECDSWKHCANEYAECLQPLIMDVLYKHCEPLSHKWPGKRHVDCIGEAVGFLLSRLADAEKVVEAAQELAEMVVVPDSNCSCHISPPCSDCVDNLGTREALANARSALTAYREKHHKPTTTAAQTASASPQPGGGD